MPNCRHPSASIAAVMILAMAGTSHAARVEPERITLIAQRTGQPQECGIAADYEISGSTLRVELSGAKSNSGVKIFLRAYAPNSVGPDLRDLWLKTTTIFTLGNFRPARMNGQGILEASGEVAAPAGAATLKEIARGDAEISIVFEGTLPAARLAVGLPAPLPADVATAVETCADALAKSG